ncbi:hypothetical protein [Streptomyces sp. NPDC050388]|uniref:hypothetical protein n=1 Tax=Streptomyces sp. NPDC050388 TaxID=3155781 RepID=UPI00342D705A
MRHREGAHAGSGKWFSPHRAGRWDETYGYDVLGNLTACATSGPVDDGAPGPGDRTYSGTVIERAGRTFYRHDGQGRVVRRVTKLLSGGRREWRYRWNAEDQLADVGQQIS